jgi:hypothetical protein
VIDSEKILFEILRHIRLAHVSLTVTAIATFYVGTLATEERAEMLAELQGFTNLISLCNKTIEDPGSTNLRALNDEWFTTYGDAFVGTLRRANPIGGASHPGANALDGAVKCVKANSWPFDQTDDATLATAIAWLDSFELQVLVLDSAQVAPSDLFLLLGGSIVDVRPMWGQTLPAPPKWATGPARGVWLNTATPIVAASSDSVALVRISIESSQGTSSADATTTFRLPFETGSRTFRLERQWLKERFPVLSRHWTRFGTLSLSALHTVLRTRLGEGLDIEVPQIPLVGVPIRGRHVGYFAPCVLLGLQMYILIYMMELYRLARVHPGRSSAMWIGLIDSYVARFATIATAAYLPAMATGLVLYRYVAPRITALALGFVVLIAGCSICVIAGACRTLEQRNRSRG